MFQWLATEAMGPLKFFYLDHEMLAFGAKNREINWFKKLISKTIELHIHKG